MKTILITGCSSGIGYAAAHGLRARGWRVFAACRQSKDCARLQAEGFDSPRIDYADEDSIASGLAEVLEATGGTLDALFNNGAHACPGAVEDLPTDALRAIFEANFFGWHTLTRAVVPVMRGAYNASKHALEGLSSTMRIEMRGTGVHVCLIEPGPVTSRFRINAVEHFERWIDWKASARATQYETELRKRLYAQDSGPDSFELPPEAVVKKLIHAIESRRPRPRYFVTVPTHFMGVMRRILPTRALDWLLTRV